MVSDNPNVQAQLAALKNAFIEKLPERQAGIQAAFEQVKTAGPSDPTALGDLRMESHKLVGTGATFGLLDLSTKARAVEHFLDPILKEGAAVPGDVIDQVARLLAALFVEIDRLAKAETGAGPSASAPEDKRPLVILAGLATETGAPLDQGLTASGYRTQLVDSCQGIIDCARGTPTAKIVTAPDLTDGAVEQALSVLKSLEPAPKLYVWQSAGAEARAAAVLTAGAEGVIKAEDPLARQIVALTAR